MQRLSADVMWNFHSQLKAVDGDDCDSIAHSSRNTPLPIGHLFLKVHHYPALQPSF